MIIPGHHASVEGYNNPPDAPSFAVDDDLALSVNLAYLTQVPPLFCLGRYCAEAFAPRQFPDNGNNEGIGDSSATEGNDLHRLQAAVLTE